MTPEEHAQGRCLGYGLFADVLIRGVTDDNRPALSSSQPIAEAIEGRDPDQVAADLERAFGWAAPPFEGALLDPGRAIGGESSDRLWGLYRQMGFSPDVRSVDAEHLSTLLRGLAFLSGAEADAIEDGHQGAVERVRELSRRLLDEHALRWVPIWASAVRRVELALPTALVDRIEELLLEHRASIPGEPASFALPEPPDLLSDESTGLRDIGEHLASAAHAGVLLTRDDVRRLGRRLEVPRGFGDRSQLLVNLLRSAARFDAFGGLLAAMDAELEAQQQALHDPRYDGIRPLVRPWVQRLVATRALLERLRDATLDEEEDAESVPAQSAGPDPGPSTPERRGSGAPGS